ncbi:MAG: hypothetical protein U1F57_10795 [bacterium]
MTKEKKGSETEGKGGSLSEMARKVILTGLGAIFMTEESIRNALSDMKLPKDAMGFVIDQAKKQKDDLISVVAAEVSKFFSQVKVHEEIQKALSALQVHIDARLSFTPKGKPVSNKLKIDVEEVEEETES